MASLHHARMGEQERRRPIKACLECYRRKQKVNLMPRTRPKAARLTIFTTSAIDESHVICVGYEMCPVNVSMNRAHCKIHMPHIRGQSDWLLIRRLHQGEHQLRADDSLHRGGRSTTGLRSYTSESRNSTLDDLTDSTGYAASAYVVEHDVAPATSLDPGRNPADNESVERLRPTYLDIRAQLPTRQMQDALIEVFFRDCDWFFGLLEEQCFREWKTEWDILDQESGSSAWLVMKSWRFTGLLFQVLAVALQFLDPHSACAKALDIFNDVSRIALSQRFSENGLKISDLIGRYDTDLVSVNHSLLRCFWLKNSGRGKEAWFALGGCVK